MTEAWSETSLHPAPRYRARSLAKPRSSLDVFHALERLKWTVRQGLRRPERTEKSRVASSILPVHHFSSGVPLPRRMTTGSASHPGRGWGWPAERAVDPSERGRRSVDVLPRCYHILARTKTNQDDQCRREFLSQQRIRFARVFLVSVQIDEDRRRLTARPPPSAPRDYGQLPGAWCPQDPPSGRGTSSAGLRSKKPTGLSAKPMYVTGITGQSSGRTTW